VDNLTRAFQILEDRREMEPRALVGFSGGKDSLACLDMAVKVYGVKNVVPFIMEFMPGLRITDEMTKPALARYGFKELKKYPAEAFFGNYKDGYYGWENRSKQEIPNVTRKSIMKMIATENKISTIIMGIKSCDSSLIRNAVKRNLMYGGSLYPIYDWKTEHVLAYLKMKNIEIPKQYYDGFRGVTIADEDILYLHRHYPDDLEKIEQFFPFIKAIVFKYERYNLQKKIRKV